MRRALGEQREVLDSMACDFSRFTTWTVTGLSRMMDQAGVRTSLEEIDKVGSKSFWEGGDDCLTDILGFLEKLEWWFEQDIDKEEERFEGDEDGGEV
ncbi:hypothetical protein Tco_0355339 [Tanacetum coccineum]